MNSHERRRRASPFLSHRLSARTWLLLAAIVGLTLSGVTYWRVARGTRASMPIPDVDFESCPPAVAQTISRALKKVARQPDSGEAWGKLGMVLFAHQFEAEANQCFEQAGVLDSEDFRWPYLLGLNQSVSNRAIAADRWRQAVRLNNESAVAHSRLGELLIDLGELAEAEHHLQLAERLQPNEVRPQVALARLAQLRGEFEEALSRAKVAVRLAPSERSTHELLATLHQQVGNRSAALAEIRIAESLPNAPLAWNDPVAAEVVQLRKDSGWSLEQARSLSAAGRLEESVQVLRDAVSQDDQDPRVVSALGRTLVQANRVDEAQRVLLNAMRDHPDSAEIAFQLGVAYFFGDRFAEAASSYQAAIRRKPDYTLAHFNLGHALEKLGDTSGALSAFQQAANYRPTYAAAHTNAGRLLLDQERPAEALKHLRQSVRLAPEDPAARKLFERASAAVAR